MHQPYLFTNLRLDRIAGGGDEGGAMYVQQILGSGELS